MSQTTNQRWRNRSNATIALIATTGILVLVHFFVSPKLFTRFDLTEAGIYSLSDVSKEAAASLEGLTITLYISDPLPDIAVIDRRRRDLRGVSQQFKDKIDEYKAFSQGNIKVVFAKDDLIEEARQAGLKIFGSDKGGASESKEAAFDEYVLGATFQYERVEEVLPIALDPGGYEYRITSILLRLKEKHEQSLVLDVADALKQSAALQGKVQKCHDAIEQLLRRVTSEDEELANLADVAHAQARMGDALSSLDSMAQQKVVPRCKDLAQTLETTKPALRNHGKDYVDRYLDAVGNFYTVYLEFSRRAESEDLKVRQSSLEVGSILKQVFVTTERVYKSLKDAPGKKRIGIVCGHGAFCPFPSRRPAVSPNLWSLLGPNHPTVRRDQQKISSIEQKIKGIQGKLYMLLSDHFGFALTPIRLNEDIPKDIDALVVVGPREPLTEAEVYRLDQFALSGKSVVILKQPWLQRLYHVSATEKNTPGKQDLMELERLNDGLDAWLSHLGVVPQSTLVMEPARHAALMRTKYDIRPNRPMRPIQEKPLLYPLLPNLVDLNQESPLLMNTQYVTFPFAQTLDVKEGDKSTIRVLATTSPEAVILGPNEVTALPLNPPRTLLWAQQANANGPAPVAVLVEGGATSAFSAMPAQIRGMSAHREEGEVRVLVIGSTLGLSTPDANAIFADLQMDPSQGQDGVLNLIEILEKADYERLFNNWVISSYQLREVSRENLFLFFRNILDWSVQNEALIAIRAKAYTRRPLETVDEATRDFYIFANMVGVPAFFLLLGLVYGLWRKRRRHAIETPGESE